MMESWKARLRAWLIELVREAIRIEREAEGYSKTDTYRGSIPVPESGNWRDMAERMRRYGQSQSNADGNPFPMEAYPPRLQPASKPVTPTMTSEPSFEQMQAQAIQEQEKFYANEAEPPRSTHA